MHDTKEGTDATSIGADDIQSGTDDSPDITEDVSYKENSDDSFGINDDDDSHSDGGYGGDFGGFL